jgi:hypothetical protein
MRKWLRKGYEVGILSVAFVLVFCFSGVSGAGQFPNLDAKTAAAWAKSIKADQRAEAEKAAIAKKYEQEKLKRQAAKVTVPQPAAKDGGRAMPSPIKTAILTPFVTVGTGIMALGAGWDYVTASMLETPVSRACRAGNTAKNQLLYHPYNVMKEFLTGFTGDTQYYDPSKLNWLGERAKKRGPIAQMAEFAGTTIPPIAASTGIVAPVLAMTVPEMAIATGVVSSVGSVGVGEAFDAAEKILVK